MADTEEKQKAFGVAYAKGILKTLGIAYIEDGDNMEKSKVTILNLDNNYEFEVDGFMKEDKNYVAIRGILEPLGYTVGWENGKVTINR